jgi:hypothetical protein
VLRLVCLQKGKTRLDLITLQETPNPTLDTSWGRVKALYAGS